MMSNVTSHKSYPTTSTNTARTSTPTSPKSTSASKLTTSTRPAPSLSKSTPSASPRPIPESKKPSPTPLQIPTAPKRPLFKNKNEKQTLLGAFTAYHTQDDIEGTLWTSAPFFCRLQLKTVEKRYSIPHTRDHYFLRVRITIALWNWSTSLKQKTEKNISIPQQCETHFSMLQGEPVTILDILNTRKDIECERPTSSGKSSQTT